MATTKKSNTSKKKQSRQPVQNDTPMMDTSVESTQNSQPITLPKGNWTERILIVLVVSMAFIMYNMWTKLQNGGVAQGTKKVAFKDVKKVFDNAYIKLGNSKGVIFIEAADPSCPFCHVAAGKNPELNSQISADGRFKLSTDGGSYVAPVPEMRRLVESGEAGYAYIYTPGHGNGEMGTKALYCGFKLGKFWNAHDLLMTKEGYSLLNDVVKNERTKAGVLAEFLGSVVDSQAMKACLEDAKYDTQLSTDIKAASSLGISGTPGFYVGETPFSGAYSWTDMQDALRKEQDRKPGFRLWPW